MKNLILIAPPAAGKGTLSNMLCEKFGYVSVSTGDMLREKAKEDENLREALKSGLLISDEEVFEALKSKLNKLGNTPYILDGFPRTVNQAVMYGNLLKDMDKELGVVIYLDVDKEELKNRVVTRMVCPSCNISYSKRNKNLFPKVEGVCDNCKSSLIQREDDSEEVFYKRYKEFLSKTSPLVHYYESLGLLKRINGEDVYSVFEEVSKVI